MYIYICTYAHMHIMKSVYADKCIGACAYIRMHAFHKNDAARRITVLIPLTAACASSTQPRPSRLALRARRLLRPARAL